MFHALSLVLMGYVGIALLYAIVAPWVCGRSFFDALRYMATLPYYAVTDTRPEY